MGAVVGRNRLVGALAALAMSFAMPLTVFTSSAGAQTENCNVKYELAGGNYFVGQIINDVSSITITVTDVNEEGDLLAFAFTSETPVSSIIATASTDVETINYDPPVTAGSVESPGEGPQGQPQALSSAEFCFGGGTTTGTTTTGTDTTTTGGTTTTGVDTTGTTTGTTGVDTTGTNTTTTGGTTTTGVDRTTTGASTTTTGKDIIITDVVKKVGFTKFEGVKKVVFFDTEKKFFFIIVEGKVVEVEESVVIFTDEAAASAQYQYSASASSTLPDTGGSGLLPLGAIVLLLGGGTAAFFAVKRGMIG